jgi:hypothetical protein
MTLDNTPHRCKPQSYAPEDGQKIAQNMLNWFKRSIKLLLLHLVDHLYYSPTLMMHGQTQIKLNTTLFRLLDDFNIFGSTDIKSKTSFGLITHYSYIPFTTVFNNSLIISLFRTITVYRIRCQISKSRTSCPATRIFNSIPSIIITQSVLREVHRFFQREFSSQYELVLSLSISNIFSFP